MIKENKDRGDAGGHRAPEDKPVAKVKLVIKGQEDVEDPKDAKVKSEKRDQEDVLELKDLLVIKGLEDVRDPEDHPALKVNLEIVTIKSLCINC